jgi:hypothetical protein
MCAEYHLELSYWKSYNIIYVSNTEHPFPVTVLAIRFRNWMLIQAYMPIWILYETNKT